MEYLFTIGRIKYKIVFPYKKYKIIKIIYEMDYEMDKYSAND